MQKRTFIKSTAIIGVGTMIAPLVSCADQAKKTSTNAAATSTEMSTKGQFALPELPYGLDALEPHIDTQTMTIHHGKHHAGYVRKLNNALAGKADMADANIESILNTISDSDDDLGLRNNGGGHYNHSLFWKVMTPNGGQAPEGKLKDALMSAFDSFDNFKDTFSKAGATQFGSGWAWLSIANDGKLFVSNTPNQDNPMMTNIVDKPGTPILGLDVWEHAYYLKYQNMRKTYINNFFNLINWQEVAKRYDALS